MEISRISRAFWARCGMAATPAVPLSGVAVQRWMVGCGAAAEQAGDVGVDDLKVIYFFENRISLNIFFGIHFR
ncbi:hypothetical protein [Massilia sp. YIM B04103]|uniref:hypothetical protein n=1 Tax=Massilia sp. YIM B04103 TaxID=2963106 RepID=UPI00210B237D|nr:hypothetical protein [Massilia sp. YIM B04103]